MSITSRKFQTGGNTLSRPILPLSLIFLVMEVCVVDNLFQKKLEIGISSRQSTAALHDHGIH